jgi:hypothetical protein
MTNTVFQMALPAAVSSTKVPNGDEAAEDRHHATEEHRGGAVSREPVLGPVDVLDVDERHPDRKGPHAPAAEKRPQPVQRDSADQRAEGGPQQSLGEREVPLAGGEPGQGQDHLAGQRGEQILQGDGQAGTRPAHPLHEVDRPSGDARGLGAVR